MSTSVVAALELLSAAGILAFWILFFTRDLAPRTPPPGYHEHERAFVVPDVTLALGLIAAACLQLAGSPLGAPLGLVCAGGLLFLGLLDLAYLLGTRRFHRPAEVAQTLAIVAWVSAVGVVLVWHLA